MLLSDKTILKMIGSGDVEIVPSPHPVRIQPVSVDLTLSNSWVRNVDRPDQLRYIDSKVVIRPGEFLLASTRERVKLPNYLAGTVVGKSTWARRGLLIEAAGLVDPGFNGTITLEMKNLNSHPLSLSAGDAICQIKFETVDRAVLRPYGSEGLGSHYQHQMRTEPARGA